MSILVVIGSHLYNIVDEILCDKSDAWQIPKTKSQFDAERKWRKTQYASGKRSCLNDIHNQTAWIDDSS